MAIKVREQTKESVYTARISCTVTDRKNAIAVCDSVLTKVEQKELVLTAEQCSSLRVIRDMMQELRPKDTPPA